MPDRVGGTLLVAGNNLNTFGPSRALRGTSTIGCNADGSPYIPPYAAENAMLLFGDIGRTQYDSLQLKLETKTPKHGLYALVSYTYSKTYDNGLSDGLGSLTSAPYFPLPNWQNLDWGLSQIDLANNFTASVLYDLPFGRGKRFGNDWSGVTNTLAGELATDADSKDHVGICGSADRQQQPVERVLQQRRQRQQLQPAGPGFGLRCLCREPQRVAVH